MTLLRLWKMLTKKPLQGQEQSKLFYLLDQDSAEVFQKFPTFFYIFTILCFILCFNHQLVWDRLPVLGKKKVNWKISRISGILFCLKLRCYVELGELWRFGCRAENPVWVLKHIQHTKTEAGRKVSSWAQIGKLSFLLLLCLEDFPPFFYSIDCCL